MTQLIQWMPVIRTSLGIAYNVLITGMSDTMDIAYKNTVGSRKYVHITYIHMYVYMRTVFRRWLLLGLKQIFRIFVLNNQTNIRSFPNEYSFEF